MAAFITSLLNILVVLTSLFLICLVLIQRRGNGGRLAGTFGSAGGSSAFGAKTSNVFTTITMFTALAWIIMIVALVILT